ncbi:MAG: bifunctional DNA primase/polymerase [Acidimicrobiales bacterium]
MLSAALAYARRGWAVFPLVPGGKEPATAHGFKDATTDPETIRGWWSTNPAYNIGAACGASKLFVVDVDTHTDPYEGHEQWFKLRSGRDDIETREHATPSGGAHVIFNMPDPPVRSKTAFAPSVDIKGDGGYIVVPPSEINGIRYTVESRNPIADVPRWLLDIVAASTGTAAAGPKPQALSYAKATLYAVCRRVRDAPEGVRNETLNEAAYAVALCPAAWNHLFGVEALTRLAYAARDAGLTESESISTITSAWTGALKKSKAEQT